MKQSISVLLCIAILFGAGYWYYTALAVCQVPISYRIGNVDDRFDLTEDEVRTAISTAESLWEDGTDRNLFTYDPEGKLVIHFIYDERQQRADEEKQLREVLEQKEGVSDTVKSEYEHLLAEYDALRTTYRQQTENYEQRLAAYNNEVAEWNTQGGAPKDVFERLSKTQASLGKEERRLNNLTAQLNTLAERINALGTQGNSIISDYNSLVNFYNDRFTEEDEFTQGDYEDDVINIYEFNTGEELAIVLAHELGHALGIDHVEGDDSIMYRRMGEQRMTLGVQPNDLNAFLEICGSSSLSIGERLIQIGDTLKMLLSAR